jgi:hypothetical protein
VEGVAQLAFLSSKLAPGNDVPIRYALHLKILSLEERHGIFHFGNHLERVADFDDILIVDVGQHNGALVAWAAWNSQIPGANRDFKFTGDPLPDQAPRAREMDGIGAASGDRRADPWKQRQNQTHRHATAVAVRERSSAVYKP